MFLCLLPLTTRILSLISIVLVSLCASNLRAQGLTLENTKNGVHKTIKVGKFIDIDTYQLAVDDLTSSCPCPLNIEGVLVSTSADSFVVRDSRYEISLYEATETSQAESIILRENGNELIRLAKADVNVLRVPNFGRKKTFSSTMGVLSGLTFFTGATTLITAAFIDHKPTRQTLLKIGGVELGASFVFLIGSSKKNYEPAEGWRFD